MKEEPKEGEKKKPHPASKAHVAELLFLEKKQRVIEIALAQRRSTDGPRGWTKAGEEEEEAKENSFLEEVEEEVELEKTRKSCLPKAALRRARPRSGWVGPGRNVEPAVGPKGSAEGLKEEKKVDKTWREEAEAKQPLQKGLEDSQKKAAGSPSPGSCNFRGLTPSQRSVRPRQEVLLTPAGQSDLPEA